MLVTQLTALSVAISLITPIANSPSDYALSLDQQAQTVSANFDPESRVFDYRAAIQSGLPADVADDVVIGLERVGVTIDYGSGGDVPSLASPLSSDAECRGVNAAWNDLVGSHVQLDSCNASSLLAALNGGAATFGIIAGILVGSGAGAPAGIVSGLVAAYNGYGITWIGACSAYNSGITININPGLPPWCWAQ